MLPHLIALDLDGTTLNDQGEISPKTKRVIQALNQEGHYVVIVTGRPYTRAVNYYDQLTLSTPMVNFNGALTHIPHHKWREEYALRIDPEIVFHLLAQRQRLGLEFILAESKRHMWADRPCREFSPFLPDRLRPQEILNRENLQVAPISLSVGVADISKQDQLAAAISEVTSGELEFRVWGGDSQIMQLIETKAHKALGLARIADYYGIPKERILAFGDEVNDFEMLDFAGRGVAMANGRAELKERANDVTRFDNEHDGLADYLEAYFDLKEA
ncbi:Cof-type HAD-IIB family hydrolase [Lactobacillus corticis]|uniref:Haloacid dehalogenase n=1 Tax=Lactobacillus corticis TaxID=2201249 RepID=A0A916QJH7_9LACO|nr:Cof-type HAD-IIB family hydrolase [Lactobacillus corticis]GFZ26748.1 haloacid dehalogenase [Lactobacillus corticis]